MTRSEFINDITQWSELFEFCEENMLHACDDLYGAGSVNERIDEDIRIFRRDYSWQSLRDMLDDISDGYDWYRRDGVLEYTPMDDEDDFEEYKEHVLQEADMNEVWEEDDEEDFFFEEDETESDEADNDVLPHEEEPISIGELFEVCSGVLKSINDK